jgi:hypothetical protein
MSPVHGPAAHRAALLLPLLVHPESYASGDHRSPLPGLMRNVTARALASRSIRFRRNGSGARPQWNATTAQRSPGPRGTLQLREHEATSLIPSLCYVYRDYSLRTRPRLQRISVHCCCTCHCYGRVLVHVSHAHRCCWVISIDRSGPGRPPFPGHTCRSRRATKVAGRIITCRYRRPFFFILTCTLRATPTNSVNRPD